MTKAAILNEIPFDAEPLFEATSGDDAGKAGEHAGPKSVDAAANDEHHENRHPLADRDFLNLFQGKTPLIIAEGELGDDVAAQIVDRNGTAGLVHVDDPVMLDHANALLRQYRPNDPTAFLGRRDLQRLADFCRAHAPHIGKRRPVFKRVAWLPNDSDGAIWLNLSRRDGACARVTRSHWNLDGPNEPIFLTNRHQRPLPEPVSSPEGYDALRRCVPPMDDAEFKLFVGVLLGMLIPSNFQAGFSYPVLVLTGQAGSGKSTLTRIVKGLTDAEHAPIATRPTKAEDVWVQARTSHVIAYDNMRPVWDGLSDMLCALTTNASQKRRTLYTDHGLSVNAAHCPVILNGISTELTRQRDLLDRTVTISLKRFDSFNPDASTTLDRDMSLALGYLCDLMVKALANLDDTHVETTSRLSLVAKMAAAAEPFGCSTPFVHLLARNQRAALLATCEHHPVLDALYDLMTTHADWQGTYKELQGALELRTDPSLHKVPEWPRTPHALKHFLKDNETLIRELDIDLIPGPRRKNGRMLTVRRLPGFDQESGA